MTVLSEYDFERITKELNAVPYKVIDGWCFVLDNEFYRLSLVRDLGGYMIEYAETKEEADKNFFEDLDVIPNDCNQDELISNIVSFVKSL
ncbi:MAG: hypothetical protein K6A70_02140 [Erysipelotrichaceae bacterium]|nr:hypothetical protein [Erysipelotrichaceae bacterium]